MTVLAGLSGGIGSGKSTVSEMLVELGATLVDADAIVHELQAPGSPMLEEIAAAFGEEILDEDGALDRQALGAIIFADAEARTRLGSIVHPPVIAEMLHRATAAQEAGAPLVVVDIPLLFEGARSGKGAGALIPFDTKILVWVPVELQIERTMARDQCSREEARQRIDAQMPIDDKRALSDHVIDNSGPLEATERQVRALVEKLTQSA